jgi:hypothetical protein
MMETRQRALVEALCSEACAGRRAGSPEGAVARDLIRDALRDAGLEPLAQPVPLVGGENLYARVGEGERVVLLGAHHDHLGRAPGGQAYWGADDNAAAVALLVEVGRALAADPPRGGQVLLVAFDAEEKPHFVLGSSTFVASPPVPLERIELMIALDLVGHAVGPDDAPAAVRETLLALGAEKSSGTAAVVDAAAAGPGARGVRVRRAGIDIIPPLSDYEPFRERGVPFLFLTAGRWRHYHQLTDTPDRLDYPKLAASTRFVEALLRGALARPERPRYLPDGRDDAGTLATLAALLGALAPRSPRARAGLELVEGLAARVRGDRLAAEDHDTVRAVVAGIESALA